MAIAAHLSSKAKVDIFHYNHSSLKNIQISKSHPNISDFKVPNSISFNYSNSIESDLCIIAIPVQNMKSVLDNFDIQKNTPILILSKGIETETLKFPLDLILEYGSEICDIAILSGPSHAEQVIMNHPTSVVVASKNKLLSSNLQKLFSNSYFRVYLSDDLNGVQIGGAVKNVISIASGIVEGLGYKENTTSALLARGLYEIKKIGSFLGAKEDTFNGLAGLGDLMATAFSNHSRNRMVGVNIAKGISFKKTIKDINMKAEGVYSSKSVYRISKKFNIDMPICNNVYNIIHNGKNPSVAIDELMNRELKSEF